MPVLIAMLALSACSSTSPKANTDTDVTAGNAVTSNEDTLIEETDSSASEESVQGAVHFNRVLDSYKPHKDHYNFYFTYKTVHPWWDAVALGMEEAQRQYLEEGIVITYEYMAPNGASATDQIQRLHKAEKRPAKCCQG